MKKAVIINSENIVENLVVWDDMCTAPANMTVVVLEPDIPGISPGWIWHGGRDFESSTPEIPTMPYPELTQEQINSGQQHYVWDPEVYKSDRTKGWVLIDSV